MEDVKIVTVGSTGNGSLPSGTYVEAATAKGMPNLIVKVVSPLLAVAVRNTHLFLIVLVATITAGGATGDHVIAWNSFTDLLQKGAIVGGTAAIVGILKDLTTVFGKLEQKFPLLTGNV